MAKADKLINAGDKIINKSENDLVKSTKAAERYVYDALMEIFKNVDITNGKLSSTLKAEDFLASLDARVFDALKVSRYGDAVKAFVGSYDLVTTNLVSLHESLGNGTISPKNISSVKRLEVAKTIANLTEQGMYADFIAPVRQGLYRNIIYGATVAETEELITNFVISNPKKDSSLLKYVGQVASDSIRQFDGSINQIAKIDLGLNATLYTGSLIDDSRAQCIKWVGMGEIKDADLQDEIDFALARKFFQGKRCGGMIPGTVAATFCIQRGGYRCRHRAFPIRLFGK